MDLPRDLGTRIVEAARLAALVHLELSLDMPTVGGADLQGEAARDGERFSSFDVIKPSAAESEVQ
jgi:hypothetical protein